MEPTKQLLAETRFSAALLIDMQPHFVARLTEETKEMLIGAQTMVIQHCAAHYIPLIVLEYVGCERTIDRLRLEVEKVLITTTVVKYYNDGFEDTHLHQELRALKAKSLLLMGINASFCVLGTAQTAVEKGYRIVTASDLIADARSLRDFHAEWRPESWYRGNGIFLEDSWFTGFAD